MWLYARQDLRLDKTIDLEVKTSCQHDEQEWQYFEYNKRIGPQAKTTQIINGRPLHFRCVYGLENGDKMKKSEEGKRDEAIERLRNKIYKQKKHTHAFTTDYKKAELDSFIGLLTHKITYKMKHGNWEPNSRNGCKSFNKPCEFIHKCAGCSGADDLYKKYDGLSGIKKEVPEFILELNSNHELTNGDKLSCQTTGIQSNHELASEGGVSSTKPQTPQTAMVTTPTPSESALLSDEFKDLADFKLDDVAPDNTKFLNELINDKVYKTGKENLTDADRSLIKVFRERIFKVKLEEKEF